MADSGAASVASPTQIRIAMLRLQADLKVMQTDPPSVCLFLSFYLH